MNFRFLTPVALLLMAAPALHARSKPPTVDPTYGLRLPSSSAANATPVAAANWIWGGTVADNQTVYLRRTFMLDAVPKSAPLYITGDDSFTLYVNGKQAAQSAPAPPNNGFAWQVVQRIDIAPFLTAGQNVLAVRGVNEAGAAGVLARLEIPGRAAIISDPSWKVAPSGAVPDDWMGKAFDDSAWTAATVEAPVQGAPWNANGLQGWPGYSTASAPYLAHITLPIAGVRDVHPGAGQIAGADGLANHADAVLTVTPAASGATDTPGLVIDFGKEVAGRVQVTGLTPGTIIVGTGESYEEATKSPWGGLHTLNLTSGHTDYTPYSAFRYAHLIFPAAAGAATPSPLRLKVSLDDKYYPVQYRGTFDCSDPLITQIWYTGAYTSHLCMQEDIWDAPKRDRARWVGDLNVSGEVINDAFADTFLMEQTLQRLRDDAQGGKPADQLPNDNVNGIPGYSCAWVCTLADFYRHIGDQAYLAKQHDLLISLLEYLRSQTDSRNVFANTLNKWAYTDWSPGFDGATPESLAATHLFLVRAARDGAFLLGAMGDTAGAAKYSAWADTLTAAAQQYLADPTTQTFGNRLQENAMAVYSGATTPAQDAAIYAQVLALNSNAWDKTGQPPYNNGVISPYYGNYVLRALTMTGHTESGLQLLRSYWGGMLAEGATTFWEAYDPYWPKQDFHAHLYADGNHGYYVSLCHGWSSGPTAWLTDDVLGVQPTSGGFQTVTIQPDLGDLQWAEGDVPTPHGLIHVRAEKTATGLRCQVTLPDGIHAHVILPGKTVDITSKGKYTVVSS